MRLTSQGFNFLRFLRINSQRIIRMVTMPMLDVYRRMRRYLNPNGFSTKVLGDVRKSFRKSISAKPESLADYVAFPRYYVAKKLLFIIAILLIVLPILYLQFLHPIVKARFFTATMYVNAIEAAGYSGRVKLLSPSTDNVLYEGPMINGRVTGEGLLWDLDGNLVYQGGFLMEMYDGEGELFYPDGKTRYKGLFLKNQFEGFGYAYYPGNNALEYEGEFSKGLYEGQGKKYYSSGVLQYEGGFAANLYHGFGRLYDPSGQLIYSGNFTDGKQEGQGILYEDGAILYEGQFASGRFHGPGKIYSGNTVFYDGSFKDNKYNGLGRAYDPVTGNLLYDGEYAESMYSGKGRLFDPQSGNLLYEGSFYMGAYEGNGRLFDPASGFLLYDGGFRMGRFDGRGIQYDPFSGLKLYEGGYLLGNYNGDGILYDPYTGMVVVESVFQGGLAILSLAPPPGMPDDDAYSEEPREGLEPSIPDDAEEAETAAPSPPPAIPNDNENSENGAQESGAAVFYSGPKTETGIDYLALARMNAAASKEVFSGDGVGWALEDGSSLVFEDMLEKVGLTLQYNKAGALIGVDVWNDALVENVRAGMTKAEILGIWGASTVTLQEILGEPRMVSISQSNRFHQRITNISADTAVTILQTQTSDGGIVQAIFIGDMDECLLIEVRK